MRGGARVRAGVDFPSVGGHLRSSTWALLALWLVAPAPAQALDLPDPTALAERFFERLYGFDALEAYEVRGGRVPIHFALARRWREGKAEIFIKIQAPRAVSKWAVLLRHSGRRSDDLFVFVPYIGSDGRVFRVTAILAQEQALSGGLPLGEISPIAPGELAYARLPDRQVGGEPCYVVAGEPRHRGLGFERVELAISPESGMALESRYYAGSRETRRVLISPDEIGDFGERRLPVRRRIVMSASLDPETDKPRIVELILRNLVLEPNLPDWLFTKHNLRVQHFPSF